MRVGLATVEFLDVRYDEPDPGQPGPGDALRGGLITTATSTRTLRFDPPR